MDEVTGRPNAAWDASVRARPGANVGISHAAPADVLALLPWLREALEGAGEGDIEDDAAASLEISIYQKLPWLRTSDAATGKSTEEGTGWPGSGGRVGKKSTSAKLASTDLDYSILRSGPPGGLRTQGGEGRQAVSLSGDASADCFEACLWLAWLPPAYLLCIMGCGSDYGFSRVPPEPGPGDDDDYEEGCEPIDGVVIGPSGQGTLLIDDYEDCYVGNTTYDGANHIYLGSRFGGGPSQVSDTAWTSAPDALRTTWPAANFDWDQEDCLWMYIQVGWLNGRSTCPSDTNPEINLSNGVPTWVAAGMMPYAAFDVLDLEAMEVDGERMVSVRIRIWVGLINHFSFYAPTIDDTATTFTLNDLPIAVWDPSAGAVELRGVRALYWLSFLETMTAAVRWETGATEMTYPCADSTGIRDGFIPTTRYSQSDGTPTPQCFSNPDAFTDDLGEMTSYLGNSAWGEVCFLVKPEEAADTDALAKRAFRQLFGPHVKVALQVKYFGPGGEGWVGEFPHEFTRSHCIYPRDLQTVGRISTKISGLRTTDEGQWQFRSFDGARLFAAQNHDSGASCCS